MSENESSPLFWHLFLVYFADRGPIILDYHTTRPFDEDLDGLAAVLQVRSTGALQEKVLKKEREVYGSLCGPDAFPTGGRAVWFNWFMQDKYAKDPRILAHGATTTLYCVFDPKDEEIINKSRTVIDDVLQQITTQLTDIDEVILRLLQPPDGVITAEYYTQLKTLESTGELTRQIDTILTKQIIRHWQEVIVHETFEKMPTPQKLQTIVNEEGSKDPAITYLVLANHKGFPVAEYSQGYQAAPRWISTATVIKMDGIRRIAHGLLLDETFYDQQTNEEGMNSIFTQLMKGDLEANDPGLILIETPHAYSGMKQTTIDGVAGEKHVYYIFARCKKTMQQGMLEMIIDRLITRINVEVHMKQGTKVGEVDI
jgi:hypothetical protein